MAEIVEADTQKHSDFQQLFELSVGSARIQRPFRFEKIWEYPIAEYSFLTLPLCEDMPQDVGEVTLLLSHKQGGHQQINARIAYNEIDLVLLFTDPNTTNPWDDSQMIETIRHCDKHNVPIATNLASAEMFIMGLQRGDLDWREMVRSKPRF